MLYTQFWLQQDVVPFKAYSIVKEALVRVVKITTRYMVNTSLCTKIPGHLQTKTPKLNFLLSHCCDFKNHSTHPFTHFNHLTKQSSNRSSNQATSESRQRWLITTPKGHDLDFLLLREYTRLYQQGSKM